MSGTIITVGSAVGGGLSSVEVVRVAGSVPSVKEFGTVGNGVADDTAALTKALSSGNTQLYMPPGTYNVTSLTWTDGVTLTGFGDTSIINCTDPSQFGILMLGLGSGGLSNVKIAGTSRRAIHAVQCSGLRFEELEVAGGVGDASHAAGFSLQGVTDFLIRDCNVHGNGNPASYNGGVSGIEILGEAAQAFFYLTTGTASQTIDGTRTRIAQSFTIASLSGYQGVQGFSMKLASNSSFACTVRVETDNAGSPSGTLADANLVQSSFSPTGTSVSVGSFAGAAVLAPATYWLVFACTAGSATFDGGTTGSADVKSYNGSWSAEPTVNNLYCSVDGSVNSGTIRGGTVTCSQSDFAILIFNATGCEVTGVTIDQGNVLGPSPDDDSSGYGIAIYDSDLHIERNRIHHNSIKNCAGTGIYYQGIGTFTQIDSPNPGPVIQGNTIVNTCQQQSDGLLLVAAIACNAPGASIDGNVIYTTGPQGAGISWQGRGTCIGVNYINGVTGRAALYARAGVSGSAHDCAGTSIGATVVTDSLLGLRSAGTTIDGMIVRGLVVREGIATSVGVYLHSATNCDLDVNVSGQLEQGVVIASENADSRDNRITGIVHDNGTASPNTYPGVETLGAGDVVLGVRSYGSAQQYGIQATGDDARVIGCDCRGNFGTTVAVGSNGQAVDALTGTTLYVASTAGFAASGNAYVVTSLGLAIVAYTGLSGGNSLTGTSSASAGVVSTGALVTAVPSPISMSGARPVKALNVVDQSGVLQHAPRNLNADDLPLYDATGSQLWAHLSYTDKALELDSGVSGGTLSIKATQSGQFVTCSAGSDVTLKSASGAIVLEADGGSNQSVFRSASGSGGNAIIVTHPHAGACSFDTDAATTSFIFKHHGAEKLNATTTLTRLVNATKNQIESATTAVSFPVFSGLDALTITLDGSNNPVIAMGVSYGGAHMILKGNPSGGTGAGVTVADTSDKLGFYGTAPILKQTGVAVTAAGIHAACVALGLFSP